MFYLWFKWLFHRYIDRSSPDEVEVKKLALATHVIETTLTRYTSKSWNTVWGLRLKVQNILATWEYAKEVSMRRIPRLVNKQSRVFDLNPDLRHVSEPPHYASTAQYNRSQKILRIPMTFSQLVRHHILDTDPQSFSVILPTLVTLLSLIII